MESSLSLSDKVMTRGRINWFERGESVKTVLETAEVLNKFFSNIANNLEISKCAIYKSFIGNIEDQALRAILKYKSNPSIIAIQINFKGRAVFFFFQRTRRRGNSSHSLITV